MHCALTGEPQRARIGSFVDSDPLHFIIYDQKQKCKYSRRAEKYKITFQRTDLEQQSQHQETLRKGKNHTEKPPKLKSVLLFSQQDRNGQGTRRRNGGLGLYYFLFCV